MLWLAFSLHRLPARGCSPGRGGLQTQRSGEWVRDGGVRGAWRRAPAGRRGARALVQPVATVTEGAGDRGGRGAAGDASVVAVLPLGAAVVLGPRPLPHEVRGHDGHHLVDGERETQTGE